MEFNVKDFKSTIHAVDSNSLNNPQLIRWIVQLAVEEFQNQKEYEQRVAWEQQISAGIRDQLEEEYS